MTNTQAIAALEPLRRPQARTMFYTIDGGAVIVDAGAVEDVLARLANYARTMRASNGLQYLAVSLRFTTEA